MRVYICYGSVQFQMHCTVSLSVVETRQYRYFLLHLSVSTILICDACLENMVRLSPNFEWQVWPLLSCNPTKHYVPILGNVIEQTLLSHFVSKTSVVRSCLLRTLPLRFASSNCCSTLPCWSKILWLIITPSECLHPPISVTWSSLSKTLRLLVPLSFMRSSLWLGDNIQPSIRS